MVRSAANPAATRPRVADILRLASVGPFAPQTAKEQARKARRKRSLAAESFARNTKRSPTAVPAPVASPVERGQDLASDEPQLPHIDTGRRKLVRRKVHLGSHGHLHIRADPSASSASRDAHPSEEKVIKAAGGSAPRFSVARLNYKRQRMQIRRRTGATHDHVHAIRSG